MSAGAYGLMFHLIRTLDATRISALQYFVPLVTMVIAWAVFGEAFAGPGFLGLLISSFGFIGHPCRSAVPASGNRFAHRVHQS